jgi:hypothetical protein
VSLLFWFAFDVWGIESSFESIFTPFFLRSYSLRMSATAEHSDSHSPVGSQGPPGSAPAGSRQMTPADLNGSFRTGSITPSPQDLCRVYAKPATVDHLFDVPPVWSQLGGTGLLSTVCRVSSITSRDEMQKKAIAVVSQEHWIALAEAGIVDFFSERVRVNGKYETHPRWQQATIESIKREVGLNISFTKWGVYSYFGRLALRVVVPKEQYGKVAAVARALSLQIERVSSSPVSVAQLTVRNVSGSTDTVPLRVHEEQCRVEANYSVSWGRVTSTETETTVLAYIQSELTAKDHYSELKDGVRTIFTSMLATTGGKATSAEVTEKTKAICDSWTPLALDDIEGTPKEDGTVAVADTAGDADMERSKEEKENALATAMTSLDILNTAIEAQKQALRKTAGSWKAYNLGAAAECAALGVLDELRKHAMEDRDETAAEQFAAWLNACPSPAKILEAASAGPRKDKDKIECLESALNMSAQPPKVSALSELNVTARQAGGDVRPTYLATAIKGRGARPSSADHRRVRQ